MLENERFVALSQGLDAPGLRRLWLVERLVVAGQGDPDQTVALVERIERFIVSGVAPHHSSTARPLHINGGTGDSPFVVQQVHPQHPLPGRTGAPAQQRGLLDAATRERFVREAATCEDNKHLARTFGLSVRQAHAIRVGLSRRIAEFRAANGIAKPQGPAEILRRSVVPQIDRAKELSLQEEFLRRRAPARSTMDDVIRFLRQCGDSIVSKDDHYLVNLRDLLSGTELVARANHKRRQRSQPLFDIAKPAQDIAQADGANAAYSAEELSDLRPISPATAVDEEEEEEDFIPAIRSHDPEQAERAELSN